MRCTPHIFLIVIMLLSFRLKTDFSDSPQENLKKGGIENWGVVSETHNLLGRMTLENRWGRVEGYYEYGNVTYGCNITSYICCVISETMSRFILL